MERQDVRLQSVGRRAHAVAESEHHQRLVRRLDDLGALGAAHPLRHQDTLGVDVFQAIALHFVGGPLDGAFERRRAAETVANRVGQERQPLPRERAAHCLANQPCRRLPIVRNPR